MPVYWFRDKIRIDSSNKSISDSPFDFKFCYLQTSVDNFLNDSIWHEIETSFDMEYYVISAVVHIQSHFVALLRTTLTEFRVADDLSPTNLEPISHIMSKGAMVTCVLLVKRGVMQWIPLPRNQNNTCLLASLMQMCFQLPPTLWDYLDTIHDAADKYPLLHYIKLTKKANYTTQNEMQDTKRYILCKDDIHWKDSLEYDTVFHILYTELSNLPMPYYTYIPKVNNTIVPWK